MRKNRGALICVTAELLQQLLHLPPGVQVVGIAPAEPVTNDADKFLLKLSGDSAALPLVGEGERYPILPLDAVVENA